MNIVAQYPNFTPLNLNIQIESVQHDSAQREIVPALVRSDVSPNNYESSNSKENKSSSSYHNSAVAEEQEEDLVYDYAKITQKNKEQKDSQGEEQGDSQNNSSPENDKKSSGEYLTNEEQKKLDQLKARDKEVRIHEQQHQRVGGQYASAPSYSTEKGPDGKDYAVGGEVQISTSEESEPEQTITKMQQVRRAALAPAEPSSQDYSVARKAQQKEMEARAELNSSKAEKADEDENPSEQSKNAADETTNKKAIKPTEETGSLASKFRKVISSHYNNSWNAKESSVQVFA